MKISHLRARNFVGLKFQGVSGCFRVSGFGFRVALEAFRGLELRDDRGEGWVHRHARRGPRVPSCCGRIPSGLAGCACVCVGGGWVQAMGGFMPSTRFFALRPDSVRACSSRLERADGARLFVANHTYIHKYVHTYIHRCIHTYILRDHRVTREKAGSIGMRDAAHAFRRAAAGYRPGLQLAPVVCVGGGQAGKVMRFLALRPDTVRACNSSLKRVDGARLAEPPVRV